MNKHFIKSVIFVWFAMARNWVSILSHIMFGIVAALAFKKMYQPIAISS